MLDSSPTMATLYCISCNFLGIQGLQEAVQDPANEAWCCHLLWQEGVQDLEFFEPSPQGLVDVFGLFGQVL